MLTLPAASVCHMLGVEICMAAMWNFNICDALLCQDVV